MLFWGLPRWCSGKDPTADAGDVRHVGVIPGWAGSPGGGNGTSLQDSCLDNPMDRGAWRATVHGLQSPRLLSTKPDAALSWKQGLMTRWQRDTQRTKRTALFPPGSFLHFGLLEAGVGPTPGRWGRRSHCRSRFLQPLSCIFRSVILFPATLLLLKHKNL